MADLNLKEVEVSNLKKNIISKGMVSNREFLISEVEAIKSQMNKKLYQASRNLIG